ncbi:MAG: hypothetical protein WDO73_17625 [Ignavibacteriota bacterium]
MTATSQNRLGRRFARHHFYAALLPQVGNHVVAQLLRRLCGERLHVQPLGFRRERGNSYGITSETAAIHLVRGKGILVEVIPSSHTNRVV